MRIVADSVFISSRGCCCVPVGRLGATDISRATIGVCYSILLLELTVKIIKAGDVVVVANHLLGTKSLWVVIGNSRVPHRHLDRIIFR